jgi:uncharacterized membrane protein
MTDFAIAVDIEAPAERTWAVIRDIERWHEWTPTVTSIRRLDEGPLRVGSRARIRQPGLPPAVWRITALDEGREFTWVTGGPGVHVTARHGVEAIARGSQASLSLNFSGWLGPLIARLTRRMNERYLGLEAQGLKMRCERAQASDASQPPAAGGQ